MSSSAGTSVGRGKRARSPEVGAFGRLLKRLRRRRFPKLAPETVAEKLAEIGVRTTGSSLRGYELGWNKAIDPVVLAGLASIYHFPLTDLIAVLAANRLRPDLSDFEVEQVLRGPHNRRHGEAQATARFAEIGARLRTIAAELLGYANDAAELAGAPSHRSGESASADSE